MINTELLSFFDQNTGVIKGRPTVERRLSDLRSSFVDENAYETALNAGDPIIYTVASVEPATGPGQLHYGLGIIMPGKVGDEYYLTKGHLHAWREAAELYFGLSGQGFMLLEDEHSGQSIAILLAPGSAVYVPAHAAHRTINTGTVPLSYLGVYPSEAGHDYGAIANRNFGSVVIEHEGKPVVVDRRQYLNDRTAASNTETAEKN